MTKEIGERVICAAIWYDDGIHRPHLPKNIISGIVVGGWRHPNCMVALSELLYPNWQTDTLQNQLRISVLNKEVQGFLTSKGRFLDRKYAAWLHKENGGELNFTDELFSEDLY